ncbi:hypothetical protein AALA36_17455 [Lachnospiraceae bacterium 66-29]
MEYDDLELDTLGEQKTALFVIISDTDATFNFVVSIMYSHCRKLNDKVICRTTAKEKKPSYSSHVLLL